MGFFIIFDYIIAFFVLIAFHASWWAWLIYFGGALFWFVVWTLNDSDTGKKANEKQNHVF